MNKIVLGDIVNKYPKEVQKQLHTIFDSIIDILDHKNIVSILFIGSGSRNELSLKVNDSKLDIFSDYEFVIVVKKMLIKSEFDILNKTFRELECKWNIKSPLFHIDYGVSTLLKFKHTPPTLWAYEAKKLGQVVYGRDVRKDLVNVDINNLDFGNLNELILIRLWNMLTHINNGFIRSNNNAYENFVIKFYYSRNILDILTILLPNNGVLKGGYRNRTNHFVNEFNTTKWNKYKNQIEKVTDFKVDLVDTMSLEETQQLFNDGFLNLVTDLIDVDEVNSVEGLESKNDVLRNKNIFNEKIIKKVIRKIKEIKLFKNYYGYSCKSIKLFTKDTIRRNLLFLLLYTHKSLSINLDKKEKIAFLQKAIFYYNIISFHNRFFYNENIGFEENFIQFRYQLLDFMVNWRYSGNLSQKDEIYKNMNWKENHK